MCAAPGGKAIHIAELLNGTGHVEARDLTEYKVALIRIILKEAVLQILMQYVRMLQYTIHIRKKRPIL